jgi:hypothetical protein
MRIKPVIVEAKGPIQATGMKIAFRKK